MTGSRRKAVLVIACAMPLSCGGLVRALESSDEELDASAPAAPDASVDGRSLDSAVTPPDAHKCLELDAACAVRSDCCSGECAAQHCRSGCVPDNQRCRGSSECCGARCSVDDGGAGSCLPLNGDV